MNDQVKSLASSQANQYVQIIQNSMYSDDEALRIGALRSVPFVVMGKPHHAQALAEVVRMGLSSSVHDEACAAVAAVPAMVEAHPSCAGVFVAGVCSALLSEDGQTSYTARQKALKSLVATDPEIAPVFADVINAASRRADLDESQRDTIRAAKYALLDLSPSISSAFSDLAERAMSGNNKLRPVIAASSRPS